jgi:acetyl-CoA carboxylase biotin carboxylase subunit
MIAKVIALGHDRNEAIEKLKRLLGEMVITGITTNQNFHLAILNDPEFLRGTMTTNYLEQDFMPRWKGETQQ